MYKKIIKKVLDCFVALAALVVLSPLFLIVAFLIAVTSKGGVFFRQTRVGAGGGHFTLYKFRSMTVDTNRMQITSSHNAGGITRVGRFIRKYHIDELPQLINVLKGDMSLVGPRPEVPNYVDMENPLWQVVLSVRPGITGLGVLKLSRFEYERLSKSKDPEKEYMHHILPIKLKMEAFYANKTSFTFDMLIITKTIGLVLA